MPKVAVVVLAATLVGCASARQERAEQFQQELPQLVAACNGWIDTNTQLDGPTIRREGLKACERLAARGRLGLTDPAAAREYVSYKSRAWQGQAGLGSGGNGYFTPSSSQPNQYPSQ
jgi:hypothetical protein